MSKWPPLPAPASEVCPQIGKRHFPAAPEPCAAFFFAWIGAVRLFSERGKRPEDPDFPFSSSRSLPSRHSKYIAPDRPFRRFSSLNDLFNLRPEASPAPDRFCAAKLKRSFSMT